MSEEASIPEQSLKLAEEENPAIKEIHINVKRKETEKEPKDEPGKENPPDGYTSKNLEAKRKTTSCPKHERDECPQDKLAFFSFLPDVFFDYYSSFKVFFDHTITWESLLLLVNATAATVFYLEYETSDGTNLAAKLDFSLVGFAIVFPLTFLLQQVFQRREEALHVFAEFRAILQNIQISMMTWEFDISVNKKGHWEGRRYLSEDFEERVTENCINMTYILETFLREPEATRARHIFVHRSLLCKGRMTEAVLHNEFIDLLHNSYSYVEELKIRGMPGNEAARINQYHWFLQARFERLRNFKWYRTPQPARSFGRLYLLVIPWFYGPYYAWAAGLSQDENITDNTITISSATSYGFAIALSLFTMLVLLGIINAGRNLEDPFTETGIDDIHVVEDMRNLRSFMKASCERAVRCQTKPRLEFLYDSQ
mmetsp:Transcript_4352/g.5363  ORF Transcript_4352/g.5363 Transcript_4352/m.5363 type:complete len:427 (+) Transcript_4352:47-1327(+)|eukprot:CAMPEP_0184027810 /NCGR_PEP_ID=MMETSP0954-20121128/14419_1 /TAXON_ID=627963 /ORGANISM="Aplanochytrium sp, Strain PBS07" /LENGTH=426 /DNA_ID=CAMNT_0026312439 /DNA_START=34 /DNA_END=1314 /DNA_ORIENTATION=-